MANGFDKESAGVAPFDASSREQFSGRFPTTHTPHNCPACPPACRSTTPPAAHHRNHSPCGCNSQRAEGQNELAAALGRVRFRPSRSVPASGQAAAPARQCPRGLQRIVRFERGLAAGHHPGGSHLALATTSCASVPHHAPGFLGRLLHRRDETCVGPPPENAPGSGCSGSLLDGVTPLASTVVPARPAGRVCRNPTPASGGMHAALGSLGRSHAPLRECYSGDPALPVLHARPSLRRPCPEQSHSGAVGRRWPNRSHNPCHRDWAGCHGPRALGRGYDRQPPPEPPSRGGRASRPAGGTVCEPEGHPGRRPSRQRSELPLLPASQPSASQVSPSSCV